MSFLDSQEGGALLMAPLSKGLFEPDTIVAYGNPAQVMRMVQAAVFSNGCRISGNFGGKVECTEYLIAPFKTGVPRVAIPGNGDRIFSMTQDDEMAFAFPGSFVETLIQGLKQAGKPLGARYPVTFLSEFPARIPQDLQDRWGGGRGLLNVEESVMGTGLPVPLGAVKRDRSQTEPHAFSPMEDMTIFGRLLL